MTELIYNEGFLILIIIVLYYIKFPERLNFGNFSTGVTETKYGKVQKTKEGYNVKSYGEKAIADWLHNNGIDYIYEPKLFGLRPDFFIPDQNTVIEYWGLAKTDNIDGVMYRKKMVQKRSKYSQKRVTLIDVFPENIPHLDKTLNVLKIAK